MLHRLQLSVIYVFKPASHQRRKRNHNRNTKKYSVKREKSN